MARFRRPAWGRFQTNLAVAALAAGLLASLAGCPEQQGESGPPFAGQKLRVLVVDDPPLAASLSRMAQEWSGRSGAAVSVDSVAGESILAAEALAADVVIYPSHLLGILADRGWIAPITADQRGDPGLDWQGMFLTLRDCEVRWSDDVLAMPLGTQVPLCYYRADLLAKFDKAPPQTWAEYQELAAFFHERANLSDAAPPADQPWHGAVEPLAEGFAGMSLLTRAASYSRHPDYFSTLFRVADMEPLIASPPFVKALEELVAARKQGPADGARLTTAEAEAAIRGGSCALALAWPNRAAGGSDGGSVGQSAPSASEESDGVRVGIVPLPGAKQVWHPEREDFEESELRRVPLLNGQGRVASLGTDSAHAAAAWQFIVSLVGDASAEEGAGEAGNEWSGRVASASEFTGPFRLSLVRDPSIWAPGYDASLAAEFGQAVQESLTSPHAVFALRIPGREEYLKELDAAVHAALQGTPPREALEQAAEKWRGITKEYGLDEQRDAYGHSEVRVF